MNFFDYFKETMTTNYFNYKGRASRKEAWSLIIFNMLLVIMAILYSFVSQNTALVTSLNLQAFQIVYATLYGIIQLVLLIPATCLYIRRCHDMNMSGWMLLIFGIPALIGLFMPGDTNTNKYGQPIKK